MVEELRYVLTQQFKAYVKDPQLYVRSVGYRPIRIDVGGEVMTTGGVALARSYSLNEAFNPTV
jgi:polysaccharide export outer membrane protein